MTQNQLPDNERVQEMAMPLTQADTTLNYLFMSQLKVDLNDPLNTQTGVYKILH